MSTEFYQKRFYSVRKARISFAYGALGAYVLEDTEPDEKISSPLPTAVNKSPQFKRDETTDSTIFGFDVPTTVVGNRDARDIAVSQLAANMLVTVYESVKGTKNSNYRTFKSREEKQILQFTRLLRNGLAHENQLDFKTGLTTDYNSEKPIWNSFEITEDHEGSYVIPELEEPSLRSTRVSDGLFESGDLYLLVKDIDWVLQNRLKETER